MNVLQCINEVLRKADEPQVLSSTAHDGVLKLKLFMKEVGRELAYNYRIPESISLISNTVAAPTGAEAFFGVTSVISPVGLGNTDLDSELFVDSLHRANGTTLGPRTVVASLTALIAANPARVATLQDTVQWAQAPKVNNLPGINSNTPNTLRFITYPQLPVDTVINAYVRYNPLGADALLDTSPVVFPPHLIILGTYAKWLMDSKGVDSPDAIKAAAVFETAASAHVAISAEAEGATKDWTPE